MPLRALIRGFDPAEPGAWMHERVRAWYPICRSITGDGLRETLRRIGGEIPLEVHEVPSGTAVFDWTIPPEWNIRDGYIADASGRRWVDFRAHNLHVMGYSVPVRARMTRAALSAHVFTLPAHPDRIPYRTSYYAPHWAFCMTHRQWESMPEGEYEVCIDSTIAPGHLSYGECVLPGRTEDSILVSAHVCHPSLANDNLSGVAVAAWVARQVQHLDRHFTWRFVFAPGTIGAIAWLARNEAAARRIRHGLILACVGDAAPPGYKRSRRGDAAIDRAAALVIGRTPGRRIVPFSPMGYDERQYGSPGFNLPVGCLTRSQPGSFPEYHTSGDDPDFVSAEALAGSARAVLEILEAAEANGRYRNRLPHCEPMLGKRGLYKSIGGLHDTKAAEAAMLWVLNLSDGACDLLDIAERSGLSFLDVREAADRLVAAGLLDAIG